MSSLKSAVKAITPQWAWKQMRKARLAYEYWSYPTYITERQYGRIRRKVEIHDGVAKDWYDKDWPELPELQFLERNGLGLGGKVFDIGAHQCIVAMMLAERVGQQGKVYAWEPVAGNVLAARRNLELNDVKNCEVVQGAVGSRSGIDTELGRIFTIDEMVQLYGKPSAVMVDVEGFEGEALKGATQLLASGCVWLVEVHQNAGLEAAGSSVSEVMSFFQSSGRYQLFAGELDHDLVPLDTQFDHGSLPKNRFMMGAVPLS